MDRDWAEPLDLDAVAAHAGYSRYHFVRSFKAEYGCTPGRYLSRRRIERAEELLRSADLSVTEICALVGFSSLGTFSSRFKRRTGLTPSEYRARYVGRGTALIPGCYALLWAGGFPGRDRPPPAAGGPAPARGSGAVPAREPGSGPAPAAGGPAPARGSGAAPGPASAEPRNSEEAD
ncbi:helix-turn-helix transcriptional regulator [Streptomyces sp. NPDC004609]|uniref:helix-turn-helix transcriptional regulator n=1 Tax=Streptomyces sp. NPDC004609 TaxID=3364704 RepID=UPI0036A0FA80